jgi:hypothetical protein
MPLVLYAVIHRGIEAVAWTWVIAFPLTNTPAFLFAFRTLGIGVRHWLWSLVPAFVGSVAIAVAVLGTRMIVPTSWSAWTVAAVVIAAGAIAYPLALWVLFTARLRVMIAFARSMRNSSAAKV